MQTEEQQYKIKLPIAARINPLSGQSHIVDADGRQIQDMIAGCYGEILYRVNTYDAAMSMLVAKDARITELEVAFEDIAQLVLARPFDPEHTISVITTIVGYALSESEITDD